MSTPNGYFLVDTNSLVYAYRAGGTRLLDTYFEMAQAEKRELAITQRVRVEIQDGPLKHELGRYIADRQIPVLDNPQTTQRLKVGELPRKNAGEESIVEIGKQQHAAGRSPRILADDKFFASEQELRKAPGIQPITSAELLNQAREDKFISEKKYREYLAGYKNQAPFRAGGPSYSPRLDTFDPHRPTVIERAGERLGDPRIAQIGLKVAGAAAVSMDALAMSRTTARLLDQGNTTGAQSEILHFAGRAGGGAAGAVAGSSLGGAVAGHWGAVGGGILGAAAGALGGDKLLDAVDRQHIHTQRGSDGNNWHYDERSGRGWTRMSTDEGPGRAGAAPMRPVYANAHLADELNYKASSTSVELALSRAPALKDPFRQAPESIGEAARSGIGASEPWTRDPQSHAWTRRVTEPATPMTHGLPIQRTVMASPEQNRLLDAAAQRTIAQNISHSPQAIAQRYQDAYDQRGWKQHGPVPAAVTAAAQTPPGKLAASDGHTYTQERNGQWTTPGTLYGTNTASPQVRQELDATRRQAQQAKPALAPTQRLEAPAAVIYDKFDARLASGNPVPGRMSFNDAHARRDEPEKISPGSLRAVGKLDASSQDKSSRVYRMQQAEEQGLMRDLGIAQMHDRERFKSEAAASVQRPHERTQDRTQRRSLDQAPVHQQQAATSLAVEARAQMQAGMPDGHPPMSSRAGPQPVAPLGALRPGDDRTTPVREPMSHAPDAAWTRASIPDPSETSRFAAPLHPSDLAGHDLHAREAALRAEVARLTELLKEGRPRQQHEETAAPAMRENMPQRAREGSQPARPSISIYQPGHPGHEMFRQAHAALRVFDEKLGRTSDQHTDNMAARMAVEGRRQGLTRIDHVEVGMDGKNMWMVQGKPGHALSKVAGASLEGANIPAQQAGQDWDQAQQQHAERQRQSGQQWMQKHAQMSTHGQGMQR